MPLLPAALDPRLPSGRPAPRVTDYAVSSNLNLNDRLVPFDVLRAVAEQVDVVRRCIEVRKAEMQSFDWCVGISSRTLKRIMADDGETNPGKAAQIARRRYAEDIAHAEAFWLKPDRINDLDFAGWLGMLMEEHFVLDAVTVYPHLARNGDLHSFELLDGATIKPLRDHRGAVPQPPQPAYQQILKGFPRGEFTSGAGDVTAEYFSDRLVYRPRNRRTWTPYGISNVDTALSMADVYLKRVDWIRKEFTDGVIPDGWVSTDATPQALPPEQLLAYELAFNAELAGITAARKGLRVLPKGFKIEDLKSWTDTYSSEFDEYLVKLLSACFGVMPTEIGFPPKSGIGGKGHQEGEANSSHRQATRPTVLWLQGLLSDIQRTFLGTPP
ncbi:MAG: hypothetical protein QM757_14835, partial [Paludibaculum sp.]